MRTGKVARWVASRGFGFIVDDNLVTVERDCLGCDRGRGPQRLMKANEIVVK
jgi:hypothetical protein